MPPQTPSASPRRSAPIRVLLVDDHVAVLEALSAALDRTGEFEVVQRLASLHDVDTAASPAPDVAVVDYRLRDGTGVDACREIRARWPSAHLVMLSAGGSTSVVLETLRAGAESFITKDRPLAVLMDALRAVVANRPAIDPGLLGEIARGLPNHAPPHRVLEPLTARELSVLRELAAGHSTKAIARRLGIAEGTVRRHVEAIRRKLGAATRLEAVSRALRHHIVEMPRRD